MFSNDIQLYVSDLPVETVQQITWELTLDNPKFTQAERLGYSTFGIPTTIKLYEIKHGILYLPRGYASKLFSLLKQQGVECTVQDRRLLLPQVEFNSSIQLRDYQAPAVDALLQYTGGVVAGCGSGKTQIMLEAIARFKQPALWVTHTKELAEQVISRTCEVFDMTRKEIGMIGDRKFDVGKRLTVALVQTLSKRDLSGIVNQFGTVAVDEAHHMAAQQFYTVINQFPAANRIWASATPDRSDGLTVMVLAAGGGVAYNISQSAVPTITPKLVIVPTRYTYAHDNFTIQISNLIQDKARNKLIIDTIATNAKGNYSLVLSDRLDHLKILRALLKQKLSHATVEILHGGLTKAERTDIMKRVMERKVDILCATRLAREGLDIPHLNRLYLTTPKRAESAIQQEVGRIMRPAEGKVDAIVFDFRDSQVGMLEWQFHQRTRVYARLGMQKATNI